MAKTILVTGATSGFGAQIAKIFAKDGYQVIATGRRIERLEALKKELSEYKVHTLQLDVRDKQSVFDSIASLPQEYKNIDILVNNAGLALGLENAPDAKIEDWETMIDTNIKGLLYVTKAVLPIMVARKSGYIFNLGSVAGTWPYEGGNVYGATKSFVQQFSFNLRTDLKGTNIRVTNIEPGAAKTEFSDVRFKGDTQKAQAVYENAKTLQDVDIANIIKMLSALPEHVNVNAIEVMATCQTWGGLTISRDQ